jgi:acetylornithine deacetylase/succinyl-diaminopimelate desuccinylase-like protein
MGFLRRGLQDRNSALAVITLLVTTGCSTMGRQPSNFMEVDRLARECSDAVEQIPAQLDDGAQQAVEHAFTLCLSNYIKIDTSNPPGKIFDAVRFWELIFQSLGMEGKRIGIPGREGQVYNSMNFLGTLRAPFLVSRAYDSNNPPEDLKRRPSIVVTHHMDTVPFFPEQWSDPSLPLSGLVKDGHVWGRGAIDMKPMGVVQMLSMAILKKSGAKIEKDIHFLAVADEESGALGAVGAMQEMRKGGALEELLGAQVILNEGGFGLQRSKKKLFFIATEEKGGAWMNLQHADPVALVRHMWDLRLVETRMGRGNLLNDCQLLSFSTDQAQVNVVPSSVKFALQCEHVMSTGNSSSVRRAFEQALGKAKGQIEIQQRVLSRKLTHYEIQLQTASSGHGSLGARSALQVAMEGLGSLGVFRSSLCKGKGCNRSRADKPKFFDFVLTWATRDTIEKLAEAEGFSKGTSRTVATLAEKYRWLRNIGIRLIIHATGFENMFRTMCTWTAFEYNANGVEGGRPGDQVDRFDGSRQGMDTSKALMDCRLLHTGRDVTQSRDADIQMSQSNLFQAQLTEFFKDNGLWVRQTMGWNFTASPRNHAAYRILEEETIKGFGGDEKVVASPFLFPAGTDNTWFRDSAMARNNGAPNTEVETIPTYGYQPFMVDEKLAATIHGSDERLPLGDVYLSTRAYARVLRRMVNEHWADTVWRPDMVEQMPADVVRQSGQLPELQ